MIRPTPRRVAASSFTLVALVALSGARAMEARAQTPTGYARSAGAAQLAAEAAAIARPDTARARELSLALSERPHVAGTEDQARTRDYVNAQLRALGFDTETREYEVWLPHPTSIRVWRVSPAPVELDVSEGPVSEDPTSGAFPQPPPIAGYGAPGDVSAELVYVNYGLSEDYAVLDSLGLSVSGKIVVARYGRSFRGIKAREAERRGAIGLLVYSDPQDDGYVVGTPYPEGPMRSAQGVQRGSYMNGRGDPSTPGWPSTTGARRIGPDEMEVPHIPIVPISHANAAELLRDLRGHAIPQAWQGGLPFRYHIGPGPVVGRIRVTTDAATAGYKKIWNTLATVRGSEFPDEYVIIGSHRDSWGPGAADNISGTISVLEAARAISEQMRQGWRPRRTLIFATWDAEEWGLVGSTEYVEEDADALRRGAVAYLNQDVAAQGPRFGAGGSPSLRAVLRDVVRRVPYPGGDTLSVYGFWRRQSGVGAGAEPPMGDPGGGSDFAGFYNHLGIPHSDWGFGGPSGVYHSTYDSYWWMSRFGDPDFSRHAAAARIGAAMMMRLANADIHPFDFVEYAKTMRTYVDPIQRAMVRMGNAGAVEPLRSAIDGFERSAAAFAAVRDSVLARSLGRREAEDANSHLRQVERALTRPEGLRGREWFRNLIYAADVDNGYATMPFPSVNEAIRLNDGALAARELQDLATHFRAAAAQLDSAAAALRR